MISEEYIPFEDFKIFTKKIIRQPENNWMIFLHDSWGCTEMWDDFPEKMAKKFHLNALIYDRRGYGKSSPFSEKQRDKFYLHEEADFLIQLMDRLHIEKALLYGHSDGATISLIAAAAYPDCFQGIMVEGAHSFVEEKGKAAVRESREMAKTNSLLKSLGKFHGDKTEELFRRWHEAWLGDFFADWTIVPVLKKITCPVLAFRGENDPYDTVEQINVLKREIPGNVTIASVKDAAHTPRKENEEETMDLIEVFLTP